MMEFRPQSVGQARMTSENPTSARHKCKAAVLF